MSRRTPITELAGATVQQQPQSNLTKAATLAAYQGAVAQATAPGHMTDDDKYAWAAYQRMFDANHRHMAEAAAEAVARAYLRQGAR